MATTGGSENTALARWPIAELLDREPYLFEFFQAVRLMARMEPQRQVVGGFNNPASEVVRFGANPDVAFPASEIQSLEPRAGKPPVMRVNFMGLHGPLGVLPGPTANWSMSGSARATPRCAISSTCSTTGSSRCFTRLGRNTTLRFPTSAASSTAFRTTSWRSSGLDTPGLQNRQDVADDSLLFYGGLLSMHSRSAAGLRQVLWDYFNVPVEIEQFVGAWYPVEVESQCSLGENGGYSEQLGFGAVVGNEIWDQQSRVRIQLGPLTLEQYVDFLPGHEGHRQLRSLTRFYTGGEYDVEVQLILRRQEVPACELKPQDGDGRSWVGPVG